MRDLRRRLSLTLAFSAAFAAAQPPGSSDGKFIPDPASVERFGPAYRYPQHGWIVVHIEGAPYERGYQYGKLMADEIQRFAGSIAHYRGPKAPQEAYDALRLLVGAVFLRQYDAEYLEEMKGIADGATAAGARIFGRKLDLLDVATINSEVET